ncbi:hypothetical protein PCANC_23053 [Puccinia coronata f. sp. avenae]|uniref:Uncharacterized protein n=1 Tax=Puccinia coronata f. sp. avenae TaxID=200324 RepID=A0A2N5U5R2_9BASI|nr:hypothetical protein PCANC_23053 [Puccinia coronata f. sp. avenae]
MTASLAPLRHCCFQQFRRIEYQSLQPLGILEHLKHSLSPELKQAKILIHNPLVANSATTEYVQTQRHAQARCGVPFPLQCQRES